MQAAPRPASVGSDSSEPEDVTPHSLARAMGLRRSEYTRSRSIRVKVGTWNVAACPGTDKDLGSWFFSEQDVSKDLAALRVSEKSEDSAPAGGIVSEGDNDSIGIYVLGLQEVVDLNMTKDYMKGVYNDNSPTEKWRASIEAAIPTGYEFVASELMTGLLIFVYASTEVAPTITNVSTKQVGTGLLGYFGNKGAVATRIVLGETTRMVFVNSHLASGVGSSYVERRCWDVSQILSKAQFDPIVNSGVIEDTGDKIGDEDFAFWLGDLNFRLAGLPGDDIRRILTLHTRGEYDLSSQNKYNPLDEEGVIVLKDSESEDDATTVESSLHSREQSFDTATSLPDPDEFPEDPSQDPTSLQATLDSLLPHDQLKQVMAQRKAFHDGWREGAIRFLPTYKYDVGSVALFDTSEKQRAPSWCDRILYRARADKQAFEQKVLEEAEAKKKDDEMKSRGLEDDEDVLFSYDPDNDGEEQTQEPANAPYDEYDENEDPEPDTQVPTTATADRISLDSYCSYQKVTSSDHKPIAAVFTLNYDCVVPELKAKVHAEVARDLDRAENEGRPGVTIVVEGGDSSGASVLDMGDMTFLSKRSSAMTIANTSGVTASFSFVDKPAMDDSDDGMESKGWLSTSFTNSDDAGDRVEGLGAVITLEPGETVMAIVEGQVSKIPFLRALNDGRAKIEDVLVLRVDGGRDHFITVRANWLPTCFGRSIDELIRVPEGGIRKFVHDKKIQGAIPYDSDVHCSAPRELFKLTEAIQTLSERCVADAAMLDDMELPGEAGWPFDAETWAASVAEKEVLKAGIIEAMDSDGAIIDALPAELLSSHKLELLSSVLLLFLASLTDGLITAQLCAKLSTSIPSLTSLPISAWGDMKNRVLDILSSAPNHNIAFVFLTSTLSRVATELIPATAESRRQGLQRRLSFRKGENDGTKKRRAREKRYAELLAPLAFRTSNKDKAMRDKERAILELFLSRESED